MLPLLSLLYLLFLYIMLSPCLSSSFAFDCDSIVSNFKLRSCYYIHFQSFGKLVVWIFEMKPDDFYYKGFLDYCLHLYFYFPNVLADMSSSLLQVFVELGNLQGTLNYVLYWIHGVACSDSVSHNWVQVLSIPVLLLACSQDWACNH